MKKTITPLARFFGLKLTAILAALLLISGQSWGQSLLVDNFTGLTVGANLAGQSSWTKGGSGPDAKIGNTTILTYSNYNGGGDEYVVIPTATSTASRVYKGFTTTTISTGTFYVSFLLRLSSTTATGDYFLSLGDAVGGTNYFGKIFAKTSGSGYVLGISRQNNVATATFGTGVNSFNQTYLILLRFTGVAGTANDQFNLWVNPAISSEPLTSSAYVTHSGTDADPTSLGQFIWHNRSINNPVGSFDGVRVAYGSTSATAWTNLAAYSGSSSTPPTLIADITNNSVDNNIDITFPTDATWEGAVTAVKIGAISLTPVTDYVLTAGNLQLKPSGLNSLLVTAGSKSVVVVATGYPDATVTQVINAGAPTTNSTSAINLALAPNYTRTITCNAKDQYNNVVAGYTFKYDAAITNNDATTAESYTIDGNALTTTTNDISVVATTDANGVATFDAALPATIDGGDGINIQVQLNDGTTNIGSAFSYMQLTPQTITFGALAPVTYGDAPFTLSATGGSSGNPVVFTSSDNNVATCTGTNGETVTIMGYGTCTIYANQAGNGSYNAAIQAEQPLVVNKKELTLPDAAAQNKTYTGTDAAVITGTLTGIVGSDAVTLNGTGYFADVNVNTGIAVTSTCTLGGAKAVNYNLTQPTGLFANITQATQTITFAALANKELGSAPFNLTATVTSGLPVSFNSSDPNVATILGNQVTIVGIGTTTITASQGGDGNYLPATNVLQPFTVIPGTIVAWQFGSPASTGDEVTYNATTNNAMLNTSILTRGNGVHYTALARGFSANDWDVSATKATAVTNNEYFQFTINAKPSHIVSLASMDVRLRRTSTGPTAYIWKYSTDGVNFNEIGSDIPFTSTADGVTQPTIDLSGIPALQNVTDATTITFRLYAWGGSSTTATFAIGRFAALVTTNSLAIGGEAICPTPGTPVFALGDISSRCQATGTVTYTATSNYATGIVYSLDALSLASGNSIVAGTGAVSYSSSWAGTTIITATASGCNGNSIATHTVTVNEAPSAVIVTPSSASICGGSIQSLTATGGTMYSANYTILDENFNGTNNSWTTINNSTGSSSALAAWTLRPDGYEYPSTNFWHSNDNSQFYLSNSDIAHPTTTATILQSPAFNTTGNTAVNLSFHHYFNANGLTAKVDYSTDGSNWVNLHTYSNDVGAPNGFVQENIALPPGEPTMYIRFKYDGAWGYYWGIDNVKITGSQFTAPITWTPIAGLYTDAGANTPYTLNTAAATVYAMPGVTTTYTATATATPGNGCFNSGISNITVTAPAIADFSYSGTPYCSDASDPNPTYIPGGGSGVFSASPAGLVFVNIATGQVDLSASNDGTYTVTNTIAPVGTCPQVVATSMITITTAPTATIHYPGTPFCKTVVSAPVILGGSGSYTGGTFTASSGDLSINSVSGTIDPSNSVAGSYTVTYTIPPSGGGCNPIPVTTQVTITALPIAGFSYSGSPYCSNAGNGSVTYSPGGVPGAFSTTGVGLSFSISTGLVNLALSTAGSYTVTNTLPAIGGCPQVTATAPITITSLPTSGISYSGTPWCTSAGVQTVTISGTTGGTFSTEPSGLAISPVTGAITPGNSNAGTYTVTYTIPAGGGCLEFTTTTSVTITALPVATFSYTGSPYNPTGTAVPTLDGVAGVFSSTTGLVFVSTATGEVDLAASTGGTYTVTNTVAAAGGCAEVTATSSIEIIVPTTKTLTVKAFIEGLYDGGGMMHEAIDFIPATFDFPMKWGAGNADTLTVALYDDTYSNIIALYHGVYISTDGYMSIEVSSTLVDSYYISVFPRNSVPVTTPLPQSFAGTSVIYNFTLSQSQAYGSEYADPMKDLGDGNFGMYTGELSHDAPFYYIDGDDVSVLDPDIALGPYGYLETDLNGSGFVDGDDVTIMDNNSKIGPLFWSPLLFQMKAHLLIQNK